MITDGKYVIYALKHTEEGTKRALACVFVVKHGGFHLLEDHINLFTKISFKDGDPIGGQLEKRLRSAIGNPYMEVIPAGEDGFREHAEKMPTSPQDIHSARQVFSYKHIEMPGPVPLVFERNHFTLNGYPLSEHEVKIIHDQAKDGEARIMYPDNMFKAEESKPLDEGHDMDRDYVCPDISNLHGYKRFSETEPKGVHIFLRSDAIDHVMHKDGFDKLKDAQKAVGRIVAESAAVPEAEGRAFHINRNSYYVNMPSHEAATQFLRNLDGMIHELPPVYSQHPHFDVGVSDDLEQAFHSLNKVKSMKVANKEAGNHVVIHKDGQHNYINPSGKI